MTKTAHTPGPWRYDVESEAVFYDDGNVCPNIAFLNENASSEQNLADGTMIAAAPSMYDALDRIFSLVSYVNIHGVGAQPEPTGLPQPIKVTPEEFAQIFQEIGKLARPGLEAAEVA